MFGLTKLEQEIKPTEMKKIFTILQKRVLKQAFEQGKELQEEVVPLSNIFSDRLDKFVDSSDNKDLISRWQRRNTTSP